MKAAIAHRYGPPESLDVTEVPRPIPGPGEVLVRVEASAVTAGDSRMRGGRFPRGFGLPARLAIGLRGPRRKVLGMAFSGTVEELGDGVEGHTPGDEVAGMNGRLGTHAQFAVVPARILVPKPAQLGHADAAGLLFGGTTALHFLRDKARLAPGARVLVNGASGAVGSSAVQLAKHFGAHVTAVAGPANQELLARLGADEAVDYTRTPVESLTGPFDLVLDAVGNVSAALGKRLAGERGTVVLAAADLLTTITARGRVVAGIASDSPELVAYLLDLAARGALDPFTRVIGGLDALPEAHALVDSGRKTGNVVVLPWA
ncbi:NAD(P)-dependent alcohol dehydrogenase [Zafaria sp. J156]|uniref:NAD(P)-dependent alcohol dehydrogenase n=1 Tax=Zafaria sp. J156 TaxID=3116490 RepID=UPI002E7A49AA|nr:NAD(P)-dependent alcohol dehydrogenase [Zafaria sp. J156]MEE1622397.1 NAD(P)-dependent alcohol dehydrogenase [Zafaria sp. J156]